MSHGTPFDDMLRRAKDGGDLKAQYNVGVMYEHGTHGAPKDPSQAFFWFEKAAKSGLANAQFNLSVCYSRGFGTAKDDGQRLLWLKKAALQNYDKALYNLGICYRDGLCGVKQDHAERFRCMKAAASLRMPLAMNDLASCYKHGYGVDKEDVTIAFQLYKEAADLGNSLAQFNAAVCFEQGRGTARDPVQARLYYQLAADQGNEEAMKKLKSLEAENETKKGPLSSGSSSSSFSSTTSSASSSVSSNSAVLIQAAAGLRQPASTLGRNGILATPPSSASVITTAGVSTLSPPLSPTLPPRVSAGSAASASKSVSNSSSGPSGGGGTSSSGPAGGGAGGGKDRTLTSDAASAALPLDQYCKFRAARETLKLSTSSFNLLSMKSSLGSSMLGTSKSSTPNFSLDAKDLTVEQLIGKGNYGEVYVGSYKDEQVAIKIPHSCIVNRGGAPPSASVSSTVKAEVERELSIMEKITPHPNLIRLVGAVRSGTLFIPQDEGQSSLKVVITIPLIVSEFCAGGSLLGYLQSGRVSLSERLRLAYEAGLGLEHLHQLKIVHRDVAARNILLTEDGVVKLSDFGLSRVPAPDGGETKSTVGPVRWMAPECMKDLKWSLKSDVWMFGVLVWEILSNGKLPYGTGLKDMEVVGAVCYASPPLRLNTPSIDTPAYLMEALRSCWNVSPEARPTISSLVGDLAEMIETCGSAVGGNNSVPNILTKESSSGSNIRINVNNVNKDPGGYEQLKT